MEKSKVWMVTGASKGLGLELATHLLNEGYKVVATSRHPAKMAHLETFDNFLSLEMDIENQESIAKAVSDAVARFGSIDVLVNNAGYGLLGAIEELSDKEIRKVFEVNVFGLLNVTSAVLAVMRKQHSGYIINIASISGSVGAAATGIYSATKAAVIQLSESLLKEVEEFGIKVTAICPGGFRTDFLDRSSLCTPEHPITEYTTVRNVITRFGDLNKNQGGDPQKAAEVFVKLAEMKSPPARLYIGSDAIRMIRKKLDELKTSIDQFIDLSQETDFE